MKQNHYRLPNLYKKRFPKLNTFFTEFNDFLNSEHNSTLDTFGSYKYIHDYYYGQRRELEYTPFTTKDNHILIDTNGDIFECDNNKDSVYTQQQLEDINLPVTNELKFQNLDFLLLIIPLFLGRNNKKDILKFLFYYYVNEKVVIKEGHEYLGKLDNNYRLDDPRIKFRDDKKFQTFSYIIFYKSFDLKENWIYKNLIPISRTMGIHIHLVKVEDKNSIEYFDPYTVSCTKEDEYTRIVSNYDEFVKLNNDSCYDPT